MNTCRPGHAYNGNYMQTPMREAAQGSDCAILWDLIIRLGL